MPYKDLVSVSLKAIAIALSFLLLPVQDWTVAFAQAPPSTVRTLQVQQSTAQVLQTRQRVALVVGNSSYRDAPLANPVNDARAIAKALEASGFQVTLRENVDQRAMLASLREFGDKLRSGGTGLFYFAGHGMQIKGRNYLVPVGAAIEREDEVAYNAVDAQAVLDKMEAAGNEANIMILDACRNNPFGRSSRSAQSGLAQMDAPVGTLVAYATAPGTVASDGTGSNGLYTQHLLKAMGQPGSKVEDVFKQVRANVRRDSQGKQVPWESTSLEGDFYFRAAPVAVVAQPVDSAFAVESALWDAVKASNIPIELRAYLSRYPTGKHADAANRRLAKLLAQEGTPAVASGARREVVDSVVSGFAVGDRWRYQVVDKYKKEVVRNLLYKVEKLLPNGDMEWNGGAIVTSGLGNFRSDVNSVWQSRSYSPEQVLVPKEMRVGYKQDIHFVQTAKRKADGYQIREEHKGTLEVIAREKVVVPAGEFNAFRVERVTQFDGAQIDGADRWYGRNVVVGWYVPELHNFVARDHEYRIGPKAATLERVELTSFAVRGAEALALH